MESRYDGYLFGGVAGGLDYATREAFARKANVDNLQFTGQVSMTNLQISSNGTVEVPDGALPVSATNDLQTTLDGKATLGMDVSFHDFEGWSGHFPILCHLQRSLRFGVSVALQRELEHSEDRRSRSDS